ncbi:MULTISPECIES: ABC transporter ATP-binding protein [Parabacteroides]|uniref:ABC transporter ATP-binding protein n=1 Tax=Parabacteroides leei TaxID=2939491 RepID=UPI00189C2BF7|nr:ABC transporter ATP-binding protein [Parabacteroides goldsteinii]
MKEQKKKGLSRLFEIAGEKKGLLILAGFLSALSACCMLVPYLSVYQVLDELLKNAGNVTASDSGYMIRWAWIAFIGLAAALLLLYGGLMASHVAAFRILYGLRVRLSEHIGRLPLGYLNGTSTGAIKKALEQNVEKIENFVAHTIPDLVNAATTVIIMFAIFFSLNGWMAAVCLLAIVIGISVQFSMMFGKKAQEFFKMYFDTSEQMSASAVQYVRGMPVVKIFGQTVESFRQFSKSIYRFKEYALNVCDAYQPGMVTFIVLLNSIVTFIIPVGLLLLDGQPGNIALAAVYLFFIVLGPGVAAPFYRLTFLASNTREIDEGVSRIDAIFAEKPVPEPANPQQPTGHDICFENVSFSYENTREKTRTEALKHINFTARAGEITALVGPSGSGKSTIANLIPRFWDVTEGTIKIGGADIRNIPSELLMDQVSFVFQDTFLFFDTLYENIRVGKPDATEEQVIAAARAAQCDDFIRRLPQGYQTLIGEGGVYLSGGEAQRVAVARAILKNSPILVLDEATAFADPENEYKMQLAIQELIREKTVIIIAHRLSSIISANQIIVLKEGEIAQQGIHSELSVNDGLYKQMWDAYTDAFQWTLKK